MLKAWGQVFQKNEMLAFIRFKCLIINQRILPAAILSFNESIDFFNAQHDYSSFIEVNYSALFYKICILNFIFISIVVSRWSYFFYFKGRRKLIFFFIVIFFFFIFYNYNYFILSLIINRNVIIIISNSSQCKKFFYIGSPSVNTDLVFDQYIFTFFFNEYEFISNFSATPFALFTLTALHFIFIQINQLIFKKLNEHINFGYNTVHEFYYFPLYYFAFILLSLAVLANNGITFFVFVEFYSIIIYFLVSNGSFDKLCFNGGNFFLSRFLVLTARYVFIGLFSTLLIAFSWSFFIAAWGEIKFFRISMLLSVSPEGVELFEGGLALWAVIFITFSIFLKLGLAPFHFWAPFFYSEIDNKLFSFIQIFSTPMFTFFIAELFIKTKISYIIEINHWIELIAVLNIIIGGVSALTQKNMKTILFYSSIINNGQLLLIVSTFNFFEFLQTEIFYVYFIIYTSVNVILIIEIFKSGFFSSRIWNLAIFNSTCSKNCSFVLITFALLSLAGFPPFGLFWAKISLIELMFKTNKWLFSLIILIMSVFSIGYVYPIINHIWTRPKKYYHTFYRSWKQCIFFIIINIKLFFLTFGGYIIQEIFFFSQKYKVLTTFFQAESNINFHYTMTTKNIILNSQTTLSDTNWRMILALNEFDATEDFVASVISDDMDPSIHPFPNAYYDPEIIIQLIADIKYFEIPKISKRTFFCKNEFFQSGKYIFDINFDLPALSARRGLLYSYQSHLGNIIISDLELYFRDGITNYFYFKYSLLQSFFFFVVFFSLYLLSHFKFQKKTFLFNIEKKIIYFQQGLFLFLFITLFFNFKILFFIVLTLQLLIAIIHCLLQMVDYFYNFRNKQKRKKILARIWASKPSFNSKRQTIFRFTKI